MALSTPINNSLLPSSIASRSPNLPIPQGQWQPQRQEEESGAPTNLGLWKVWEDASRDAGSQYTDISDQYKQFMSGLQLPKPFDPRQTTPIDSNIIDPNFTANLMPSISPISYTPGSAISNAEYEQLREGYGKFAETGGFTPEQISAIRARGISPVRSVYANAERNVNRQRALQGGYSPGFGALTARMAREQGQSIADASTNVEASLAGLVQQGKLRGLSGLAGIGEAQAGRQQQMQLANLNNQLRTELANAEIAMKTGALDQASKNRIQQLKAQISIANQSAGLRASELTQRGEMGFEDQRFKSYQSMRGAIQNMQQNLFRGIEGQRSLYGTTPAVLKTFGDQIAKWFQLGLSEQEIMMRFQLEANKLGLDINTSGKGSAGKDFAKVGEVGLGGV